MPVENPGVGGDEGMESMSRTEPRRSAPMLILSPPDDQAFVAEAQSAVEVGMTPAQLELILRAQYPNAVVRERELIGERFEIWYVYRDGHWTPTGHKSKERG